MLEEYAAWGQFQRCRVQGVGLLGVQDLELRAVRGAYRGLSDMQVYKSGPKILEPVSRSYGDCIRCRQFMVSF